MSVIITVADIKPPAPGKKQASVIDSTGKRWGIAANEMSNYQQFGTYEISRFKESFFQGKAYYTIEAAVQTGGGTNAVSSQPLRPTTPVSQSVPQGYSENQRRMDIFVCGAFNNIMGNPSTPDVNVHSSQFYVDIINNLKAAWKLTLGPQAQPIQPVKALNEDMNDDIPF